MGIEIVAVVAAAWLGSLFVYTGSLKLLTPVEERIETVRGYRLGPTVVARLVAVALPYAELACGLTILVTPALRLGAVAVGALGLTFAFASGSALARGLRAECGRAGKASGLVERSTVTRALLTVVAALTALAVQPSAPLSGGWVVLGLAVTPAALVLFRRYRARRSIHHHQHHVHHPVAIRSS